PRDHAPRRFDDAPVGDTAAVDKLRRKQERLISLLVEKGVLAPGEIDGLEGVQLGANA
nr:hypothetical protein [Planctomycetota bacterium]